MINTKTVKVREEAEALILKSRAPMSDQLKADVCWLYFGMSSFCNPLIKVIYD